MTTPEQQLADLLSTARGILFDFNGTLSDDEAELARAYAEALTALGLEPMRDGEYDALLGRSEPDIALALVTARGHSPATATATATAAATRLLDHVADQYIALCAERPRVADTTVAMVHTLRERGVRVGIVTGTLRRLITPVLSERGLTDAVEALVTVEDVTRGKPDPEGFLAGARALGLADDPGGVVVFEDSRAGVAAAQAAGMRVIGIGPAAGTDLTFPAMTDVAEVVISSPSSR